jgi:hypothetical protein
VDTVHEAFAGYPGNSAATKQPQPAEAAEPPHYGGIVDLSQKSLVHSAFSRPQAHHTSQEQQAFPPPSSPATGLSNKAFVVAGTSSPIVTTAAAFLATGGGHNGPKKSLQQQQQQTPSSSHGSTTTANVKSFNVSPTKATASALFAAAQSGGGGSSSPYVGDEPRHRSSSSSSSSASSVSFQSPTGGGAAKNAKYQRATAAAPSFLRYYSDPLGSSQHNKTHSATSGSSPQSAPPVIMHTSSAGGITSSSGSTTTIGYYMDGGQVVAVTNPDYNVEKTVVISSGKQQPEQQHGVGLNLCYTSRTHHQPPDGGGGGLLFSRPQLDLSEWVGHRVLVRRGGDGVYYPGVIAEVRAQNDLHILLDRTNESLVVKSPLTDGHYGGGSPSVISDAIPLTSQVEIGSKVCVRQPRQGRSGLDTFVEAVVYEVCRQPLQFLLKLGDSDDSHKVWVTRAALRLQEPPWLEELAAVADYPQETVKLFALHVLL